MKKLLISLLLCLTLVAVASVPVMANNGNGCVKVPFIVTVFGGENAGNTSGFLMLNNGVEVDPASGDWINYLLVVNIKDYLPQNYNNLVLVWSEGSYPGSVVAAFPVATNGGCNINWNDAGYFSPGDYTWYFEIVDTWTGIVYCKTAPVTITLNSIP